VLADALPSVEEVGAVVSLASLGSGVAGYVGGALAEAIARATFGLHAAWADKLFNKGLVWGAYGACIYYLYRWLGWA
jgi:hypothetical protein